MNTKTINVTRVNEDEIKTIRRDYINAGWSVSLIGYNGNTGKYEFDARVTE